MAVPSAEKIGRIRASRSGVSPARGRSSAVSPPTGTSSASNAPRPAAATARRCERSAYASCRSRLIPARAATRSAASPISGSPSSERGERGALGAYRGRRRLHPTREHRSAGLDQGRPDDDRGQPAAALPIDGQARHADPESGLQRRVAGEVTTGSGAVAEHHLGHLVGGEPSVAEHRRQHRGGQVGGRQRGQPVPGGADGRPPCGDDRDVMHRSAPADRQSWSRDPVPVHLPRHRDRERIDHRPAAGPMTGGQGAPGDHREGVGVDRIGADRDQHRAQPRMGPTDHHHLAPRVRSQRRLDVGQGDGRPTGRDGVGPAGDDEPVRRRRRIRDRRPSSRSDRSRISRAQHRGIPVLAPAEPRRGHPQLAVADVDIDLGEGSQRLGVATPGHEGQLGRTVVVVHRVAGTPRPCRQAPARAGPPPPRPPARRDHRPPGSPARPGCRTRGSRHRDRRPARPRRGRPGRPRTRSCSPSPGPAPRPGSPGPTAHSRATTAKLSTQEAAVRTTHRGAPEVPEVGTRMVSPVAYADRSAAGVITPRPAPGRIARSAAADRAWPGGHRGRPAPPARP